MLCLNAEGKAGADIVVESLVEELDRVARWGMIVIFEADRTLSSKVGDDILLPQPSGHKVLRHYGGKGTVSYKVMVHRVLAPRVMRVVTADRSVRIDLQTITVGDASRKLCSLMRKKNYIMKEHHYENGWPNFGQYKCWSNIRSRYLGPVIPDPTGWGC